MESPGDAGPSRGHDPLVALDRALGVVGDRWSLAVVAALLDGPLRYGELQARLPGIAPNVLSARLRHLEGEGLVAARPYSRRPPRSRYEATDAGRELAGALRLLAGWGAQHGGEPMEPPRHEPCGTPLEVRWWCPSCEQAVDDAGLGPPPEDQEVFV